MFNNIKITLSLLLILTVAQGCTSLVPPVVVETRNQCLKPFHPPLPNPIHWSEVKWLVLTPELMREYLVQLDKGVVPSIVIYSLSPNDYESLAANMGEIKRFIKGTKGIIMYYRSIEEKQDENK